MWLKIIHPSKRDAVQQRPLVPAFLQATQGKRVRHFDRWCCSLMLAACVAALPACEATPPEPIYPPAGTRDGSSPDYAFAHARDAVAQQRVLAALSVEVISRTDTTIRSCRFVNYQVRQEGQARPRTVYFNIGFVPVPGGDVPCALRPPGLFWN
jgi:hypothetical protein